MRYRALDANGDYTFGRGSLEFLINSVEAVAQAVKTRLALFEGEFFLDKTIGTPYNSQILGENTLTTYDIAIQNRIIGTQGVSGILNYSSSLNNRDLSVSCTIDTIYGATTVEAIL